MEKKIALILAGCGYLDGSEIREAVLTILNLDEEGFNTESGSLAIFAADDLQFHTINHKNSEETADKRNILAESARIARGAVSPLSELQTKDFDALIIPGGFGIAKNYSNIALMAEKAPQNLASAEILPQIKAIIEEFHNAKKPIGAICIAPALIALALRGKTEGLTITLGNVESNNGLAQALGAEHKESSQQEIVIDKPNRIISTPAYMLEGSLANINRGIQKLVTYIAQSVRNKI